MVQKIFGLGLAGSGIVAVLIVAGIILKVLNVNASAGDTAIWAGVAIGLVLGLLGIFGVIASLSKRFR